MRYLVATAVAMMVFAGPARAQFDLNANNKTPTQLHFEKIENERKENEKAYNAQMKRLKGQNPTDLKRDPWATVRPADSAAKR